MTEDFGIEHAQGLVPVHDYTCLLMNPDENDSSIDSCAAAVAENVPKHVTSNRSLQPKKTRPSNRRES